MESMALGSEERESPTMDLEGTEAPGSWPGWTKSH